MYEIHFTEIPPTDSEIISPDPAEHVNDSPDQVDYSPLLEDINKNLENITNLLQEQNNKTDNPEVDKLDQIKTLLKSIDSSVSSNSIEIEEVEEEVQETVSFNSIMSLPLNQYSVTESFSFLLFAVVSFAVIVFCFFDRR